MEYLDTTLRERYLNFCVIFGETKDSDKNNSKFKKVIRGSKLYTGVIVHYVTREAHLTEMTNNRVGPMTTYIRKIHFSRQICLNAIVDQDREIKIQAYCRDSKGKRICATVQNKLRYVDTSGLQPWDDCRNLINKALKVPVLNAEGYIINTDGTVTGKSVAVILDIKAGNVYNPNEPAKVIVTDQHSQTKNERLIDAVSKQKSVMYIELSRTFVNEHSNIVPEYIPMSIGNYFPAEESSMRIRNMARAIQMGSLPDKQNELNAQSFVFLIDQHVATFEYNCLMTVVNSMYGLWVHRGMMSLSIMTFNPKQRLDNILQQFGKYLQIFHFQWNILNYRLNLIGMETVPQSWGSEISTTKGMALESASVERKAKLRSLIDSRVANLTGSILLADKTYRQYMLIPRTIGLKGVKKIGKYAFYNQQDICYFVDTDDLECISQRAFEKCNQLRNIQLGNKLTKIGNHAYAKTYMNIHELVIPDTVGFIGSFVFEGLNIDCIRITSPKIRISEHAFDGACIKRLIVPEALRGSVAFNYCGCPVHYQK